MRAGTFSAGDLLSDNARTFLARRAAEISGSVILFITGALSLALATWNISDPSWNHASDGPVHNLMAWPGAIAADMVMQLVGISIVATLTPVACWGWRLLTRRNLGHLKARLWLLLLGSAAASALASLLPVPDRWPLPTGLGGVIGDAILSLPRHLAGRSEAAGLILAVTLAGVAILALTAAAGFGLKDIPEEDEDGDSPAHYRWVSHQTKGQGSVGDAAGEPGFALTAVGAIVHAGLRTGSAVGALVRGRAGDPAPPVELAVEPAPSSRPDSASRGRQEPSFDGLFPNRPAAASRPVAAPERGDAGRSNDNSSESKPRQRVSAGLAEVRSAQTPAWSEPLDAADYELPPLAILTEARRQGASTVSEDALEQNARLLEGVLDDFGVRGEIINVRPGPVVTLYELEPAPGIKSSRVIGLADDIARSMSAVAARVAVVQGRNVIGIELPNQRRETVFLRELIGSEDFAETKSKLAIALGKTIGGEPVIVDLARMPHLLVAGTTGSGKSVAINTMILSLLYRMKPEECRLIMVDPKMLELSIYDGIPHLLTPVVTDPKKAVVALKWAVREMEDRYKKMSKIGVRNIDGFNARVAEAVARGEVITRTVQTGYDKQTGEAVYEHEDMDLTVLPYIVVIVDEMADLMMVAGKEIEGAIQRLAQMARAAGIHLIMATQRPSVDVITGTIKANFPTRISFQVTSKIDSRTILGEMGAEQLLGQGDMLHMAGGGRISRVHGPFVSDGEVEKVVNHLKAQGRPDYLDAITAGEDEENQDDDDSAVFDKGSFGEEGGDLYDQAVRVVLRDKKCSTSYIQRRLQVGYNKAASLVERMEREGLVGPSNPTGKREILMEAGTRGGDYDDEDDN